jgi:hypothetical protein
MAPAATVKEVVGSSTGFLGLHQDFDAPNQKEWRNRSGIGIVTTVALVALLSASAGGGPLGT